jgi:hypothetical protein
MITRHHYHHFTALSLHIQNTKTELHSFTFGGKMAISSCGNDGKVSKSDNLYLLQTESNPKCHYSIMGGKAVYIG